MLCYAIARLMERYPDKAEEIHRVLSYWVHELRERFRLERASATAAGFELDGTGWVQGSFITYYDLYRYAEYGFNRKQCHAKWLDSMCLDYDEAYEHWLQLLEDFYHAMAWLGLAPPATLEQWAQKSRQGQAKPPIKPITIKPKTIIEWLMAGSRGQLGRSEA